MTPQEIEALKAHVEQLEMCLKDRKALCHQAFDANDALKAERDALATQVYLLKDSINKCTIDNVALLRLSPELKQIVAATPQQCLRDIQAEAGRAGYYEGFRAGVVIDAPDCGCSNGASAIDHFRRMVDHAARVNADQYAAILRQGGAK